MKARGALLQGAIAAGALALVASTWLRGPETVPDGSVVIANVPSGTVQSLVWEDGTHRVAVERIHPGEPGVWVRISRSASLLPPDAGVDAGPRQPAAGLADAGSTASRAVTGGAKTDAGTRPDGGPSPLEIAPPAPDRELRGNETAEKLLEQFSPFAAARALGVADAAKVRELGLEAALRKLDVSTPTTRLSFSISSPVGTGASYLRSADGRVFVLGGTLIQDLTSASSRLVDRRVHAFKADEADRLVIHLGTQTRTLIQRRVAGTTKIFGDAHTETPDAYAQGWVDRLSKLIPSDVLGKGEVPLEGNPLVELRVDFQKGNQTLGFVEFGHAQNGWFVRSEHSVGWMRVVGRAEPLVHDADRLVSSP